MKEIDSFLKESQDSKELEKNYNLTKSILNIPRDKEIEDYFRNNEKDAEKLLKQISDNLQDKKIIIGLLEYRSNMLNKKDNIFSKALKILVQDKK